MAAQSSGTPPTKLGNETRSSALPEGKANESEMGAFGPPYDYAGELPTPKYAGVYRGDSMDSVFDAMKGAFYYVDMIGFGESSNSLTRGKPIFPMGINYYAKTGAKCSNGAEMYTYIKGVTQGDLLGKTLKRALADSGLPGLKGLAPGVLEDAKEALNPFPVINTVMGSGYPRCKLEKQPIGDFYGRLKGVDGTVWIPETPDIKRGSDGRPYQEKWVLDTWLSQEEYQKEYENRQYCPDGIAISKHPDGNCSKAPIVKEKFQGSQIPDVALPATLLVCLTAALYLRYRK
jgi:hypothetical protein